MIDLYKGGFWKCDAPHCPKHIIGQMMKMKQQSQVKGAKRSNIYFFSFQLLQQENLCEYA